MIRALAPVLVAALLAGCGDSGISKADFIKKANKICADATAKVNAASGSIGDNPTKKTIERFISDKVIPATQQQFDDIRDLGFPEADEKKLEKLMDESQAILDKLKDDPGTAIATNPFGDVNAQVQDYGLTKCGSG